MAHNVAEIKSRITNINITDENLTGRAGLIFISRYLRSVYLEFNFSNIHGALVNPSGEIMFEHFSSTLKGIEKDDLLDSLFTAIEDLQEHASAIGKSVFEIGMGMVLNDRIYFDKKDR